MYGGRFGGSEHLAFSHFGPELQIPGVRIGQGDYDPKERSIAISRSEKDEVYLNGTRIFNNLSGNCTKGSSVSLSKRGHVSHISTYVQTRVGGYKDFF